MDARRRVRPEQHGNGEREQKKDLIARSGHFIALSGQLIARPRNFDACSGHVVARPGHFDARSGDVVARSGHLIARSGRLVASSAVHLGANLEALGSLGPSWAALSPSRLRLGVLLELFWGLLGPSRLRFGVLLELFWGLLGVLRTILCSRERFFPKNIKKI